MNFDIVWIGKYQECMKDFKISGSISKFGIEKEKHFVFNPCIFDNYENYVIDKIKYFLQLNREIKFYFYDQNLAQSIKKQIHIQDNIICTNSEDLLSWLNNKSISREWIRNTIKTPATVVLSNNEITISYLKNIFWGYKTFVAQKMISSGGHKTYLIDKDYPVLLDKDLYIVSPYYNPSLSINITSIIYSNNFIVFPISIQIIEIENSNLLYKGSDFISTEVIPAKLREKVLQANKKILEQLKQLNYLGICGIDFLLYNDEIYFIEFNPRFQGSSFLIEKSLQQYNMSLYQLNFDSFYKEIDADVIARLSNMKITYSFRKDVSDRKITETGIIKYYPEFLSTDYYDYFADKYHIMLKDWESKIETQGKILRRILKRFSKLTITTILDCTCGIGIQSMSLAQEGLIVTGSDISQNELDVATKESHKRNLDIEFILADCRYLEKSINKMYDAVISIDSALPHLMTKNNFLLAFHSIYNRLHKGGVFISSYRDYELLQKTKPNMAYPVRFNTENGIEYVILRKWKWEGEIIFSKQYVIEDSPSKSKLYTNTYKQWAITKKELLEIVKETEYTECHWLTPDDSGFSQPILCLVK